MYLAMSSDYTIVIALVCWCKPVIFGAETHLGGGVMGAFVFLSAAIAWALAWTFIGSTALSKGPWRFWLHCHEFCHAL